MPQVIFVVAVLLAIALAPSTVEAAGYLQTNLVASHAQYNPTFGVDEDLINPWGIALRPPGAGGHIWINNAGTGTVTEYIGDANGVPLYQDGLQVVPIVTSNRDLDLIETASDGIAQPTGQVYNAASDVPGQPTEFYVEGPAINYDNGADTGIDAGPAKFVFVTIEGTINAWRTKTNPGMLEAVVIKDYSREAFNYSFTGVAMSTDPYTTDELGNAVADNRLYVTDFGRGNVLMYDNQWNDITDPTKFQRPADLPGVWHPFNIQQLADGRIYVAWAENSLEIDEPSEEIPGPGFGRIVAYDRDGNMLQDYSEHANLNAPWGMAIAPGNFGEFSNALLVANFGDGTIAGYDVATGAELGYLRDTNGEIISIDGIWGLTFGNGVSLGDNDALYFTAGTVEETEGLFGSLRVVPHPGDYNRDGAVDAADYTVWRNTMGSNTDLRANGDDTGESAGVVDEADYRFWKAHFGESGGGASAAISVPEPAAAGLLAFGAVILGLGRRNSRVVVWQLTSRNGRAHALGAACRFRRRSCP